MQISAFDDGFILRLKRGQELMSELTRWADDHKVVGAWIQGLGGAESAELAIYRYDTDHKYHTTSFAGPLEVMSLQGSIARTPDNKVALHLHATISGSDLLTYGGHVQRMVTAGTIELSIDCRPGKLSRKLDSDSGLLLLQPADDA